MAAVSRLAVAERQAGRARYQLTSARMHNESEKMSEASARSGVRAAVSRLAVAERQAGRARYQLTSARIMTRMHAMTLRAIR